MMSTEQVKGVFQQVLLRQIAKTQQVVATSMSDRDFSTKESIRNDTLWHWAYRWLAARGPYANVDDVAEGIMREAGLSEAEIYGVAERLVGLRYQDMVPIPPGKISTLLEAVGAVSTESNIALAQQAYFRAMSQAAALSARSQREGSAADAVEAEAVVLAAARDVPPVVPTSSIVAPPAAEPAAEFAVEFAVEPATVAETPAEPSPVIDIIEVGEKLIKKNAKWPAPGLDDTDLSESGPALELHRA